MIYERFDRAEKEREELFHAFGVALCGGLTLFTGTLVAHTFIRGSGLTLFFHSIPFSCQLIGLSGALVGSRFICTCGRGRGAATTESKSKQTDQCDSNQTLHWIFSFQGMAVWLTPAFVQKVLGNLLAFWVNIKNTDSKMCFFYFLIL